MHPLGIARWGGLELGVGAFCSPPPGRRALALGVWALNGPRSPARVPAHLGQQEQPAGTSEGLAGGARAGPRLGKVGSGALRLCGGGFVPLWGRPGLGA